MALQSDLALCSALAQLAWNKLNVGKKEDAQTLLQRAEKIYASSEQFLRQSIHAVSTSGPKSGIVASTRVPGSARDTVNSPPN